MKQGDKFKIKPDWCDTPDEADLVYECTEINETTGVVYGVTHDTGLSIVPLESFHAEMIVKA